MAGFYASPSDFLSLRCYSKGRNPAGTMVKTLSGSPLRTACPDRRDPNFYRRVGSLLGQLLEELDQAIRHRKKR